MVTVCFRRCKKLMNILAEDGYLSGCQILWTDLKEYIERWIGADPRTVAAYRKRLVAWGFLKPVHLGRGIFQIATRDKHGHPITQQTKLEPTRLEAES